MNVVPEKRRNQRGFTCGHGRLIAKQRIDFAVMVQAGEQLRETSAPAGCTEWKPPHPFPAFPGAAEYPASRAKQPHAPAKFAHSPARTIFCAPPRRVEKMANAVQRRKLTTDGLPFKTHANSGNVQQHTRASTALNPQSEPTRCAIRSRAANASCTRTWLSLAAIRATKANIADIALAFVRKKKETDSNQWEGDDS